MEDGGLHKWSNNTLSCTTTIEKGREYMYGWLKKDLYEEWKFKILREKS